MSPPIPPATVAIPPTTRPDPPPLDWDGPHRRLDRAAQEMMGGEGRPVLGAAGARSRFVIVHHPTPAVRLHRHPPSAAGRPARPPRPAPPWASDARREPVPRPGWRTSAAVRGGPAATSRRSRHLPSPAGVARPRSASARRLARGGLAVAPAGLGGLAGRLLSSFRALRCRGSPDG